LDLGNCGAALSLRHADRGSLSYLRAFGQSGQNCVDLIFPYFVPDYVQYRYVKEYYFRWMPPALFHAIERQFGWHLCLTAGA
jgi:hypothetical protein